MVLENVKLYLDGTMLRFESDNPDFFTVSTPTGRVQAMVQGNGLVFTDVIHETIICTVESFEDVLDAAGAPYGVTLEAVIVALNAFLNFKTGGGGTDTNFANTDLVLDENRLHDFDGNYMLLNSVGFTDPASTEPAFILDPIGGLFGAAVVGFKSGLLSGVNTNILQQDDGGGLKTVISTQDPASDTHFVQVTQSGVFIAANNGGDANSITVDKTDGIELKVEQGTLNIDIPSADAIGKLLSVTNATNKEVEFIDASSVTSVIISTTPPADTAKLWFNSTDDLLYFNDGADWVSEQLFEVTFNEQGNTPNNTFFRVGNTITNDLGIGYYLEVQAKIEGLTFNRLPGTAAIGNYWLYSNSVTGTDIASVVGVFTVDTSARGFVPPNAATEINTGSYITIRWNGAQTNNNIVSVKYRKKHV
jgi:hypothetical protein